MVFLVTGSDTLWLPFTGIMERYWIPWASQHDFWAKHSNITGICQNWQGYLEKSTKTCEPFMLWIERRELSYWTSSGPKKLLILRIIWIIQLHIPFKTFRILAFNFGPVLSTRNTYQKVFPRNLLQGLTFTNSQIFWLQTIKTLHKIYR